HEKRRDGGQLRVLHDPRIAGNICAADNRERLPSVGGLERTVCFPQACGDLRCGPVELREIQITGDRVDDGVGFGIAVRARHLNSSAGWEDRITGRYIDAARLVGKRRGFESKIMIQELAENINPCRDRLVWRVAILAMATSPTGDDVADY